MSKVIALTGMPASGKGEVSNIAKERGWSIHRIGALVWAETERRGLELTPSNVGKVANGERETHGMDIWAIRSIPIIKDLLANGSNVLIDGMRGIPEQETFKSNFGDNLVYELNSENLDIVDLAIKILEGKYVYNHPLINWLTLIKNNNDLQ